ncbi:MAG TPA: MFS transporter [Candidatus Dojkabacteria bacterium]
MKKILSIVNINFVIQFLTYSDIMMLSGWGLITPILAVFISDKIDGADVGVAGIATTIYFITKSVLQIPVARYIDKRKGEHDDYWIMIIGSILISAAAFMYIFATQIWQVYAIQAIYGIGSALSYPTWLAIFTRHIDKNHEGFEWSMYYTTIDLGSAFAAGLGGLIAVRFGYQQLFLAVGVLSVIGTVFLTGIRGYLKKR